jgi:hypothetical protein
MLTRHTVSLHHVIEVYNNRFDHMDSVMPALSKKKTQWMEHLFITVKLALQMLFIYYAEVTPIMGMVPISVHILKSFQIL